MCSNYAFLAMLCAIYCLISCNDILADTPPESSEEHEARESGGVRMVKLPEGEFSLLHRAAVADQILTWWESTTGHVMDKTEWVCRTSEGKGHKKLVLQVNRGSGLISPIIVVYTWNPSAQQFELVFLFNAPWSDTKYRVTNKELIVTSKSARIDWQIPAGALQ